MKTLSSMSFKSACLAAIVAVLVVAASCGASGDAQQAAPVSDEALMAQGLNKLYQASDPFGAEAIFREVLKRTPTHYGAHYQLAVALDRGGKPTEARPEWDRVRRAAQAIGDSTTLSTARRRLAAPDTASQDALMALGLHLVWTTGNFPAAITQFRAVLRRNPTHYGATYQLAATLDRNGQAAQARPVWEKVLGMATLIKDEKTIQIARDRLK